MRNFTRRPQITPELHRFSPLADPVPTYGVGVELTETGMWLRIEHQDGKAESAFVSAPWLRWLAASGVAARAEGFELMKQRTPVTTTAHLDSSILQPIGA